MLIKPQGVTNSFTLLTMQLWKVSLIGSESGFINLWFLLLERVVCGHQQQVLDFWRGKFANFLFLAPQVKAVIVIMLKLLWKYPLFFWFGDYLYCLLVMLISLLLLLYDVMMYCTWGFYCISNPDCKPALSFTKLYCWFNLNVHPCVQDGACGVPPSRPWHWWSRASRGRCCRRSEV